MTRTKSQAGKTFSGSRPRTIGFIAAYCILLTAYFQTTGGIHGRRKRGDGKG